MKKVKLFVHINNTQKYSTAEIDDDQKVGHLVKEFAPKLSHNEDFLEDVEVYLEDNDEDFDKGISIREAGIKHGDHIFVGRCKKVSVNINYAGKIFTISVGPSTSIKKLKKLSLNHFNIDEVSGAELLLWFNNDPLDMRQLVGSLTDYPSCGVNLVLATKNDVNGDVSYDLFQEHLNSPEYESGEIEGRWGVLTNGNGPNWPISILWIKSLTEGVFNFKFDFSDYPNLAPTAVIWDVENQRPLAPEIRPKAKKRAVQVFKNWGKECNYLPCDRMAFEGHPAWPQEHSSLIWNPRTDTFQKYLNEVYQILNP
jgi:hypothetical protein